MYEKPNSDPSEEDFSCDRKENRRHLFREHLSDVKAHPKHLKEEHLPKYRERLLIWQGFSKVTSVEKEKSYFDHLRSKAQKRSGNREFNASRRIIGLLPHEITSLREALDNAREILKLKNDWDDAGSVGYSESTWNRVQGFLMRNALKLWRSHQTCFAAPKIMPGPEGSFDLHWKTKDRELLINVPAHAEESIAYYGDDNREGTENAIRGKDLESSKDPEWIFLWLMK
jgi:hypothetical protein